MFPFEYARSALKLGLQLEARLGANPFKSGMIGSTDTHTGLTTVDEDPVLHAARNAGILAAQMLAIHDGALLERVIAYKKELEAVVLEKAAAMEQKGVQN